MARSRNIKPSFWKNDLLAEIPPHGRLLFIGLWSLADRNGLLEKRPARIKAEIFPYEHDVDVNGYLTELERLEFVATLSDDDGEYIYIENFNVHQNPHKTETTRLPCPKSLKYLGNVSLTVRSPLDNGTSPADSLTLIPDSCSLKADSLRASKFAFEGDVIKLTHKDFEKWKSSFSAIYDLKAELQALDDWFLKPENEAKRKNWFHMVSGILKKEHVKQQKIQDETKVEYTPEEKVRAKAYEEKLKAGYDPNEKWDL